MHKQITLWCFSISLTVNILGFSKTKKLDEKYSERAQIPVKAIADIFDRYFHIPLPIVTKHELGLPFPPRNLPIKFGKIVLVIVVTDRHTHRDTQTNAGENIFPRFRGDNKNQWNGHVSISGKVSWNRTESKCWTDKQIR